MKRLSIPVILSMFLWLPVASQAQSQTEKDVAASVEQLRKLLIDPDSTALSNLVCDQLSYGHSSGHLEDKKTFIHSLVSGESDFITLDLSEQTIAVVDRTAIVRHVLNASINDHGKPGVIKLGVLTTWVKQKGQWKLLARQAVHI